MDSPVDKNEKLVAKLTFVPGDKGFVSINNDDIVIDVCSGSCYRVIVYKLDIDFSF